MEEPRIKAQKQHDYLSDAYIFSWDRLSDEQEKLLTYGQKIVESQWLLEFPMLVIFHTDKMEHFVQLYKNVNLLYQESWGEVDRMNCFLVNKRMYDMIKDPEDDFSVKLSGSQDLLNLFNNEMFVVATVKE